MRPRQQDGVRGIEEFIRGRWPRASAGAWLRSSLGYRPPALVRDEQEAAPGKKGIKARRGENTACWGYADKAARVSGRQTRNRRRGAVRRPEKLEARRHAR